MDRKRWSDRALGCLVGLAVGDAWGEASATPRDGLLTYTDDTQMALGLVEELAARGRLEPSRLLDRFAEDHRSNLSRAYGTGAYYLFSLRDQVVSPSHSALLSRIGDLLFHDPSGSLGNGAAMRTAPLGAWFVGRSRRECRRGAETAARTTHLHAEAVDAAVSLTLAVREVVRRPEISSGSLVAVLIRQARTPALWKSLQRVQRGLARRWSSDRMAALFGLDERAVESYPFALWCFLRHRRDFRRCLGEATGHGGDADTLGAMACGLAGAEVGFGALPAELVGRLENLAYILDLGALWTKSRYGRPRANQTEDLKARWFPSPLEDLVEPRPWADFDDLPLVRATRSSRS